MSQCIASMNVCSCFICPQCHSMRPSLDHNTVMSTEYRIILYVNIDSSSE